MRRFIILAVFLAGAVSLSAADFRLKRHFSDNMVLQRDQPLLIEGFADPGAAVTLRFAGQEKQGKADADGTWKITLDPVPANREPQEMTAKSAGGVSRISNVLVGDVWLVARQTSINVLLSRDEAGRKAAAAHKSTPLYRAISIQTIPESTPQADLDKDATIGWVEVDQEAAYKMTAAAYYFGRDLADKLDVPVGLMDVNLGAAFPVAWLSRESLMESEKFFGKTDIEGNVERMEELAALRSQGEPPPRKEVISSDPVAYALYPAAGYNAVIHPLKGLALKGLILHLGGNYPYMIYADLDAQGTDRDRPELNRAYVETYNIRKVGFRMDPVTTPRIPREWRQAFANENLPMALVMPPASDLPTLAMHAREMRELQRLMAEDNPDLGLILPGYENIPFSAQPRDESLLAERSVKWALGAVYGQENTAPTGPLFERLETHLNQATIYFKEATAKGLSATGEALDRFEVAGAAGDYAPARAEIDGEVIRLESDTVNRILYVRYNWSEHPDQGLVNASGLPAIPFRTEEAAYDWFVTNEEVDLPIEYSTPANEWEKSDVTLVNGQLKTHGYDNFSGWLGPVGIKTGPFGPNMGVREIKAGSPAEGKLLVGDVIYSANGNMLGDKAWEVMADAITESETRAKNGSLVLGLRRDGDNIDVEVTLEVMGTYSSTAPYDCPKTEKIITDLESWVVEQGAGPGYLNTDALFLLANGKPELQRYVRRIVYDIINKSDPNRPIEPTKAGKSWHNSAEAILLGEYFHATGDRNVLPYLKHACDRLAATQNESGGWRHNYPGGPHYGFIPNAGLPGVIGMYLAKQAGVDIDLDSYQLGLRHFLHNRAQTGYLIYGSGMLEREVPRPIDPEALATGHLETYNGGLSAAGILGRLSGDPRAAHFCSFLSAYAWNNTFHGHGGNFWNNFWTPLGAHDHSREAYINFWKNYRWYRESNRMFDGSLIQHESGKVGAGAGVALVAPRQRIRIVGAPASPFAVDAPEAIKPAVEAYWNKDYAGCENMVRELLASGTVGKDDLPTVEYLGRAAREIQESIALDLARIERLAKAGQGAEAKADLVQLAGILPDGDQRLAAARKAVAGAKAPTQADRSTEAESTDEEAAAPREWTTLVTEIETDQSKSSNSPGKVSPEEASVWRMKVVENLAQAPAGWVKSDFDDGGWKETHLPVSWRMYHTVLLRTTFDVEDPEVFDGLRFRGWLFRQQGIEIYLNGVLIGKVNNLEKKTGNVESEFKQSALRHLKSGKNTLAVTSRHNWRWGMLFMRVYNDGFGFRLDARQVEN